MLHNPEFAHLLDPLDPQQILFNLLGNAVVRYILYLFHSVRQHMITSVPNDSFVPYVIAEIQPEK